MGSYGGNVFGADRLKDPQAPPTPIPGYLANSGLMPPSPGGVISDIIGGGGGDGDVGPITPTPDISPPVTINPRLDGDVPDIPAGNPNYGTPRVPGTRIAVGGNRSYGGTLRPSLVGGMVGGNMIPGSANAPRFFNPRIKPTVSLPEGGHSNLIGGMVGPTQTPTPITPTPTTVPGGLPGENLEAKRARIRKNRDARRARGEIT